MTIPPQRNLVQLSEDGYRLLKIYCPFCGSLSSISCEHAVARTSGGEFTGLKPIFAKWLAEAFGATPSAFTIGGVVPPTLAKRFLKVERLLEFAEEHGLLLRLIEFMPLEDDVWTKDAFISGEEILSMLPGGRWIKENGGSKEDGPAQYFVNEATGRRIGVIDAVSNHFCKNCNRLRVSAEGGLRTCLFSENETPLKDILERRDAEELRAALLAAARAKPRCWSDVKTGTLHMSGIGG